MQYIITTEDLDTLISLSGIVKSLYSPVNAKKYNNFYTVTREASLAALQKLELITCEVGIPKLSYSGNFITRALLNPQKMICTVNSSLPDNAPVSYLYSDGFWTVLAPDIQNNLQSIFSPVLHKNLFDFVQENMFSSNEPIKYEPFELSLSEIEAIIFQLTQMVILNRVNEKNSALDEPEQWFDVDDIFSEEIITQFLEVSSIYYENIDLRDIFPEFKDAQKLNKVLSSLKEKGVLSVSQKDGKRLFSQSQTARKWLMPDTVLDRIVIQSVIPKKETSYFHLTKAGLLSIEKQDGFIIYKSLPEIKLEYFN